MAWYAQLGFSRKIQWAMGTVTIAMLFLALLPMGFVAFSSFKSNLENIAQEKTHMLASVSAAGVVFEQAGSVNELLASLEYDRDVESAIVYKTQLDSSLSPFAFYDRQNRSLAEVAAEPQRLGWHDGIYRQLEPILLDGELIGELHIVISGGRLWSFIYTSTSFLGLILLLSIIMTLMITQKVRGYLAKPINDLSHAAQRVALDKNYSQRVVIETQDELGELGASFNKMLAELESYDHYRLEKEHEIIQLNAMLEEKVRERTSQLESSLEDLKLAQTQMVEQEKMASLGGLVAGVAHEINTPIGISITAASHLDEGIRHLDRSFKEGRLTKTDFSQFMEMLGESNAIIQTNLHRAAELVKSFKLVAVDQSNEQSRLFDLREYLHNVHMSLGPKLKKTQHRLILNVPENMTLYCDPGIFSQIMTNLVMNSLIHGFKGIDQGSMQIDVTDRGHEIEFVYRDNGLGLAPQIADRIFEPFVTTTRGQGGSGLGTHIVYNLVTQGLKGKISCETEAGKGVIFTIVFPRKSVTIPQPADH